MPYRFNRKLDKYVFFRATSRQQQAATRDAMGNHPSSPAFLAKMSASSSKEPAPPTTDIAALAPHTRSSRKRKRASTTASHRDATRAGTKVASHTSSFQPIPKPGPGDWLADYKDDGQTYAQWCAHVEADRYDPHGQRPVVYVREIRTDDVLSRGAAPTTNTGAGVGAGAGSTTTAAAAVGCQPPAVDVEAMLAHLSAFLYPIPVKCLAPLHLTSADPKAPRRKKSRSRRKASKQQSLLLCGTSQQPLQNTSVAMRPYVCVALYVVASSVS